MRVVHPLLGLIVAAPGAALLGLGTSGPTSAMLTECGGTSSEVSIEVDAYVALPYAEVGQEVEAGTLTVVETSGTASAGPIEWVIDGPFQLSGDAGPLAPGEARTLTLTYTGSVGEPTITEGLATVQVDGAQAHAQLYAVVGDPALPSAQWISDRWGVRTTAPLPSAPFPHAGDPWTDSSVLVALPSGLTDQGDLAVVTHLHGFGAVLSQIVDAHDLVEQHALSGRDALLIVPQGPYNAQSGDFGKLMDPGGHKALVRDSVTLLYRDGFIDQPAITDQIVTSHSGGYQAAARIIEVGGLPITAVHLFDSLYALEADFLDFASEGGIVRSNYTSSGGTADNNLYFQTLLAAEGIPYSTTLTDDDLLDFDASVGATWASHDGAIRDERSFARWLARSTLRPRPDAPPELRGVLSDGDVMTVSWIEDGWPGALTYQVEVSDDGQEWNVAAQGSTPPLSAPAHPYVRLTTLDPLFGPSAPSDVYGGTGDEWLVVDGFDRVLGSSWGSETHPFAARLGLALGAPFSTTSAEAVVMGEVDPFAYPYVLWMLGDEGTSDVTFDAAERALLAEYVAAGGKLLVSGAEVGYATDKTWLRDTLHTTYVRDDAWTNVASGYTFGVTYPEDYPDVLSADVLLWTYAPGEGAAVGWNHQVIVVGFPLETLGDDQIDGAMEELATWLTSPSAREVCYPGPSRTYDQCLAVTSPSPVPDDYVYPAPYQGSPQYQAPVAYLDLFALDGSVQVAPNFSLDELAQPEKGQYAVVQTHAVEQLQGMRDQLGALQVTSGYRSPAYNAQVGGATYSRHTYGDAFDLVPLEATLDELIDACYAQRAAYVALYDDGHVHCDWRDDPLDEAFYGASPAGRRAPSEPIEAMLAGSGRTWTVLTRGFDEGRPLLEWTAVGYTGEALALGSQETFTAPADTEVLELIVGRALVRRVWIDTGEVEATRYVPGAR